MICNLSIDTAKYIFLYSIENGAAIDEGVSDSDIIMRQSVGGVVADTESASAEAPAAAAAAAAAAAVVSRLGGEIITIQIYPISSDRICPYIKMDKMMNIWQCSSESMGSWRKVVWRQMLHLLTTGQIHQQQHRDPPLSILPHMFLAENGLQFIVKLEIPQFWLILATAHLNAGFGVIAVYIKYTMTLRMMTQK